PIHCPLSIVHYPLSTIHSPLSIVHYPLSTIHSPLFIVHYPFSIIYCPLSILHYLLSTIHSPLFIHPIIQFRNKKQTHQRPSQHAGNQTHSQWPLQYHPDAIAKEIGNDRQQHRQ